MSLSKGIIYFTDNELPVTMSHKVQSIIKAIAQERQIPIVCSSLLPTDFGDINLPFPEYKRGTLTMFRQILGALQYSVADIVYFCEHDVLYHPSHFDFVPFSDSAYYYNTNVWRLWMDDGIAVHVNECMQVSGLCGYRSLLYGHYKRRVIKILQNQIDIINGDKWIKNEGFSRHMGYEPGGHMVPRGVDEYPMLTWSSEYPIIDLRHGGNFTKGRRHPEEFHDKRWAEGWTESKDIPGWGNVSDIIIGLGARDERLISNNPV